MSLFLFKIKAERFTGRPAASYVELNQVSMDARAGAEALAGKIAAIPAKTG
jgi:hypothetical protein